MWDLIFPFVINYFYAYLLLYLFIWRWLGTCRKVSRSNKSSLILLLSLLFIRRENAQTNRIYMRIRGQIKIKDKTENFPNSLASRRGREQLKINFTTASLFKDSSNYVESASITVPLFFSRCKSFFFNFFFRLFYLFSQL